MRLIPWKQNLWIGTIVIFSIKAFSCLDYEPDSELFSSSDKIKTLFKKEKDLTPHLEKLLVSIDELINELNDVIKSTQSLITNVTKEKDVDEYVSNPINTFVLLKRAAMKWPKIIETFNNDKMNFIYRDISKILEGFPNEKDVEGALNGIFLLQETYNLDIKELFQGTIHIPNTSHFEKASVGLTLTDMLNLGKLSFNRGFYDRAYEWLSMAIEISLTEKEYEKSDSNILLEIKSVHSKVVKYHDLLLEKRGSPRGKDWKTFILPLNPKLASKKKYESARKLRNKRYTMKPKIGKLLTQYQLWEQFNRLCRGENLRSPDLEKHLKCTYIHYEDPYLKLGPFMMEVHNKIPFLAVFHNFLFENEMEQYKSYAKPKLFRSHFIAKGEKSQETITRTSKQAWLFEEDEKLKRIVSQVSRRIRLATHFETYTWKGGEPYQVANYGIGGVYNAHMDSGLNDKSEGDRVATIMGYLSDVHAGGGTAFPNIGVKVSANKGSIVFWYNIDRNGHQDYLTFHGGCPVLSGNKWITNKWIRHFWQWQRFPCTIKNEKAYFPPLSNSLGHHYNEL